ncbi:molybdopterin cofactor-binding domain-containing protein [Burkholderia pseudomallei]|uniref:xanthine dehydrogenase family protein molybdopterin-binding subunit n=1 Tax=Burkholderia pseudomallei TaxID=28450 RepID=UPI003F65BF2F
MNYVPNLSRRQFIVATLAAGGVLVLGLGESETVAARPQEMPWDKPGPSGSVEFTPWLCITPDDTVVVRVTTPDVGNGVLTQAASYVMEELGCSWDKIRPEYASTYRDYLSDNVYSKGTGILSFFNGRSTHPEHIKTYMQVAASARERLKAAAAQLWGVKREDVVAEEGRLTHKKSGRSIRFGEALPIAARVRLNQEPTPKDRSQWTFLGKKAPAKMQIPSVVNGSAVFGIDVRLPDMVYAALRQAPVHGGRLKSFNADRVKNMPGVLAIVAVRPKDTSTSKLKMPFPAEVSRGSEAVAVIAEHYWQARVALDALPIEWEAGSGGQWKTTEQIYQALRQAAHRNGGKPEVNVGDTTTAFKSATKIVEATYHTPYCEQSPMEPLNGTARVDGDGVEVWHPSQHTQMGFLVAADEAGVPPERVHFHQTYVGGGFGRRVNSDDVRMVVAVAKAFPGRPVHVIWSREEATRQGRYRPASAARYKAGLGSDGLPTAFAARITGGPGFLTAGVSDTALVGIVPNVLVESEEVPLHILTGPYRGPGYNSNAFMLETFIDECAHAAGIDPLEYRIRLYRKWPDAGWVKCLEEVRKQSGWGETLPRGQGRGVAIANWEMGGQPNAGTTVATVAKVKVAQDGKLQILQLDVAFDTGRVMNEDAVRVELEGGTLFGLNMTLNEELTIHDGAIVEGNFDTYPMLRMANVPRTIRIHFGGLSDNPRYSPIGEPPTGPVGPAVGNAIFAAIGKRIRSTPFRKQDLRWT